MNEHDLLSIKEFSELTGIRQTTLRHYDDIKLFQPVKRGENGYRYYSAPQAVAINFIHVMSSLNIPLKTIGEIQTNRTPERILDLLHKQELSLNQELYRLHQAYSIIHTYREMISEGLLANEHSISRQWVEATPIELGKTNDFTSGLFYDSFFHFIKKLSQQNVDIACPVGGYYQDFHSFMHEPGQPTRYFSLTTGGTSEKAAGEYLFGYARGYYGQIGDLPKRMQDYAEAHTLLFVGPVYELYLHDEISMTEPDQYLIQASVPIQAYR